MKIYEENNKYYANLNIDGFQIMERIKLTIKYENGKYLFAVESTATDNNFSMYDIGDILFSFTLSNNEIHTEWNKLQPILEENKKEGIYFK